MHILIIPGVTMPKVEDSVMARIRQNAGPDAKITLVKNTQEAEAYMDDVEIILGVITPEMFKKAKKLTWVHAITSGADSYLFPEMVESEVMLSGDKGLVGSHLADHTFALLLSLTRRLASAVRDAPHSWKNRVAYRAEEFELEGCTMGVVGFGGTGRHIARRAAAFGMKVIAVDCDPVPPSPEVKEVWGSDRLDELLKTSDVVASGLPLTKDTFHMFNARTFGLMKPTALFVNVTRGELFDPDALMNAIKSGKLAGAGLDTAPEEPLPSDHPLWTTPNLIMTPHTAGASQFRIPRNLDRFCRNIELYRASKSLEGQINKRRGF